MANKQDILKVLEARYHRKRSSIGNDNEFVEMRENLVTELKSGVIGKTVKVGKHIMTISKADWGRIEINFDEVDAVKKLKVKENERYAETTLERDELDVTYRDLKEKILLYGINPAILDMLESME